MLKLPIKLGLVVMAAVSASVVWQRGQLEVLALSRIDPVPEARHLVAEERYAEAADYLGFFMEYEYVKQDPSAQTLMDEIDAKRSSVAYQAAKIAKIAEGLVDGTSNETIGQVAGVTSDLFVIGDIRDLTWQAIHWSEGEEVDEVAAALAAIGIAASAAQLATAAATAATAGTAAPAVGVATAAKGSATVLKAAKKLGKLPSWLGKAIVSGADLVKRTGSWMPSTIWAGMSISLPRLGAV